VLESEFSSGFFIAEYSIRAVFTACCRQSEYNSHRQGIMFRDGAFSGVKFPDIAGVRGAYGYAFCGVDNAAAPNCQHQGYLLLFAESYAGADQTDARIRFNSTEFNVINLSLAEALANGVQQSAAYDTAASVMQKHFTRRERAKQRAYPAVFTGAVYVASGVAVIKIQHVFILSCEGRLVYAK
jgi:hypothetical protein